MKGPAKVLVAAGGASEGGGGTYVFAIAQELSRSGDRGLRWRFLVSPSLAERLEGLGVELTRQPRGNTALRVLWEQAALVRNRPDEVVVAAGGFGPLIVHRPYVLIAHNALYYGDTLDATRGRALRLAIERRYAWASARRAATVFAPSAAMAARITDTLGVSAQTASFGPGLIESAAAPPGPFTFAHRTHWGPHKGFGTLLRATRALAARRSGEFRLRSASDPCSRFARSFRESEGERRLLSDPLVREHVDIAPFPLASLEHRRLLGHAVVVPSATESFSFPLAEALAVGLPIVTVLRPYASELCGRSALYVRPGDSDQLATAMEQLLDGARPPAPDADRLRRLDWSAHVDALAEKCHFLAAAGSRSRGAVVSGAVD